VAHDGLLLQSSVTDEQFGCASTLARIMIMPKAVHNNPRFEEDHSLYLVGFNIDPGILGLQSTSPIPDIEIPEDVSPITEHQGLHRKRYL
jgi:hypothetical protein